MTKVDIAWVTTGIVSMLFTFGLAPTLLYFRVRKKSPKERRWWLWLPVSVLLTWFFLLAFRLAVELPVELAKAKQGKDLLADGTGGNVAILVAGWIIPLIGCLLFASIFTLVHRKKKPNQSPEPTPGLRPGAAHL